MPPHGHLLCDLEVGEMKRGIMIVMVTNWRVWRQED